MTPNEIRALKDDELNVLVGKLRNELFDLRTKRVSENVENTSRFGNLKRDIARALTEQRSRRGAAQTNTRPAAPAAPSKPVASRKSPVAKAPARTTKPKAPKAAR